MSNHIEEFIKAVKGGRGDLDAWLECNNEEECRAAIIGAIAEEEKRIAKDSLLFSVDAVLRDALDRVDVHPCDQDNDEVKARGLSQEMKRLYDVRNKFIDGVSKAHSRHE